MDETEETVTVGGSASGLSVTPATITITDDDTSDGGGARSDVSAPAAAEVSIAAVAAAVEEGQSAVFTVTRNRVVADSLTVAVQVAEQGSVVAGKAPTAVKFAAGAGTATLTVATVDDETDEPDGAVSATLSGGPGYVLGSGASATVAVNDNDEAPAADDRRRKRGGGCGHDGLRRTVVGGQ